MGLVEAKAPWELTDILGLVSPNSPVYTQFLVTSNGHAQYLDWRILAGKYISKMHDLPQCSHSLCMQPGGAWEPQWPHAGPRKP